jgi:hypothetical protein
MVISPRKSDAAYLYGIVIFHTGAGHRMEVGPVQRARATDVPSGSGKFRIDDPVHPFFG